jgi:hypothetical protein
MILKPALLSGLVIASAMSSTFAQEINPDPVYVFNRICYSKVHDVEAIRTMALKLAWRVMPSEQLAEFNTYQHAISVDGWDVQVGERLFQVGLVQAPVTEKMKAGFPDFAGGKVTTCSLVMDDQQLAEDFLPDFQKLAGKEPISRDVPEGLLLTTTWAGGNDDLKVFLFAKVPPTGKGGLLNVTILQQ